MNGLADLAEARAEVARFAGLLRARGLAVGTSGNVSLRLDDGTIAITPATFEYEEMGPDDVVFVDPRGAVVDGPHRASSETPLHLAIYASRPAVAAIVHSHSPFATAFAAARREIPAAHYVLAALVAPGGSAIRVASYATFGTEELARAVVETIGADNAVLLANHGALAVASSLRTAFARAERIEELAMLAWRAEALGGAVLLDAAELDRVRDQMERFPRQEGRSNPARGPIRG